MTDTSPKRPRGTMPTPTPTDTAKTYWNGFHQSARTPTDWVTRPNPLLVDEVRDLPAGTALDLGCGAGGDAVRLAENGWRVTAADVSAAVLTRAATAAARAGVGDRIDWQEHDLTRSLPAGTYGRHRERGRWTSTRWSRVIAPGPPVRPGPRTTPCCGSAACADHRAPSEPPDPPSTTTAVLTVVLVDGEAAASG